MYSDIVKNVDWQRCTLLSQKGNSKSKTTLKDGKGFEIAPSTTLNDDLGHVSPKTSHSKSLFREPSGILCIPKQYNTYIKA